MNVFESNDRCHYRILGFSDTYGANAGNGVARFLHDIRSMADSHQLPLELVVPAKEDSGPGLIPVRAPAFAVPGYPELQISMPLRHHRKQIERHIKTTRPDCIHISTPGPFGCFGIALAQRYRIPMVGIFHTDFASYAREIVSAQLVNVRNNPTGFLNARASQLLPYGLQALAHMSAVNPNIFQDVTKIGEILSRNFDALSNDPRTDNGVSAVAEKLATSVLKKFYSNFDLVIARSTAQQHELAEQLQLNPAKVQCLRPGTNVEKFHPRYKDPKIWKSLGVPDDAFVVLYVGRITPEKNIPFLQRTWEEVQSRQSGRRVCLVVVGNGDDNSIEQLRNLDGVHWLGPKRGEELSRIYASSDLLVFPSTTETLGQVGLEACASGVPVIVSDQGGPQMYVDDGRTGFVLSTDNPSLWSERIRALANADDTSAAELGANAREHVAEQFTFEHSLRSYWDLHGQAITEKRQKKKSSRKRNVNLSLVRSLQGRIPQKSILLLSDFHAGKRFGNPSEREQKQAAVAAMLSLALEKGHEIVFGGDFGDHGARVSRLEADFEAFRSVRERLGVDGQPLFIRGNHDYGFTDERLNELTGGCRVHDSLVYYDPMARVTICHGHIFGLLKTQTAIHDTIRDNDDSRTRLLERLREDALDEELKPSVIAYDIANMIETGLADRGMHGLSTAWEGVYQYRAMLAEQILKFSRGSNQSDEVTWKMIAGLVGTHDNVEVAAMLGVACGGWASLFGHTHEPLAKRKRVRTRDGSRRFTQLVGNSGHINRKFPTCVVADFPAVTVYRYVPSLRRLKILKRIVLSDADVQFFGQVSGRSDEADSSAMNEEISNRRGAGVPPFAAAGSGGEASGQYPLPS
ncbi:MAG: glycosyltransferase [Rhodopirellula sp. JB044]|uniref:glycosyltransferase n=1 Tax=Rhodopirellula sp. JB044 TaxID=3342844 RepID=UPI00370B223B